MKKIKVIFNSFISLCVRLLFRILPLRNIILLESSPDYSDNTYYLYQKLIENNINKNYKIYWITTSDLVYDYNDNVYFINRNSNKFFSRVKLIYLKHTSKCLVCSNYFLPSYRKSQFSIYLTHGMPIKDISTYYYPPKEIQYCLCTSQKFAYIAKKQFHCDDSRLFICGQPRNDVIIYNKKVSSGLSSFFDKPYKKIIGWYPTFRQHKEGHSYENMSAIPIIDNLCNAKELDKILKEENILLVIKPHPAQDISKINNFNLENIQFIDEMFFKKHDIKSYDFVSLTDAFITDYSSIYFDYILADKPIAVTWNDIEEYRKQPGFALDVDYYLKGAEKIYNINDFKKFIINIANDRDVLADERNIINNEINIYNDPINSQMTLDFILGKLK